jgi:hypothetical protein
MAAGLAVLERRSLNSGAFPTRVQDDATDSTVVSGSGAQYPCSDPTSSQQQLTRGASDGPVNLCYDANNAADRQHLTLYYMPDGSTVLAKIPLG